MLVEFQSGLQLLGILPIGIAVLCAMGFFFFILQSRVIPAFGLALAGAIVLAAPVLLDIKSKAANPPFEVIIVNDQISPTGFLRHESFEGGKYASPYGTDLEILRDEDWPRVATLVINDSLRLVTVRRFHYSASSELSAGSPLMEVIFPGQHTIIEGYLDAMEDEGVEPPPSIQSSAPVDMLDILYRTNTPYDPVRHGTREELLSQKAESN
jgi:hypothetical protein